MRCDAALREYWKLKKNLIQFNVRFVLSVGIEKSAREQMAHYIHSRDPEAIIQRAPLTWGDEGEIHTAIKEIQKILRSLAEEEKLDISEINVHTRIISNREHRRLIKLYWLFFGPKNWHMEFVPTRHRFGKIESCRETWKLVLEFLRLVTLDVRGKLER